MPDLIPCVGTCGVSAHVVGSDAALQCSASSTRSTGGSTPLPLTPPPSSFPPGHGPASSPTEEAHECIDEALEGLLYSEHPDDLAAGEELERIKRIAQPPQGLRESLVEWGQKHRNLTGPVYEQINDAVEALPEHAKHGQYQFEPVNTWGKS